MLAHPATRDPDGAATPAANRYRLAYSPAEAAAVLGVTRQTIHSLINRGVLRRYKVGRCTRLNAREVHALVGGDPSEAA